MWWTERLNKRYNQTTKITRTMNSLSRGQNTLWYFTRSSRVLSTTASVSWMASEPFSAWNKWCPNRWRPSFPWRSAWSGSLWGSFLPPWSFCAWCWASLDRSGSSCTPPCKFHPAHCQRLRLFILKYFIATANLRL